MNASAAMDLPMKDFPLDSYPQSMETYFNSKDTTSNEPLLTFSYQAQQLKEFNRHYYSTNANGLSPWSQAFINAALPFVKAQTPKLLENFNNQNQPPPQQHYAENFKRKDHDWWVALKDNMNLPSIKSATFQEKNRAIAITNTLARALPDNAPDFYHPSLPGQGFPFDNLQTSAVWAGTPLYVVSLSKDKAWSLSLTPDGYFAWIKSEDLAYTSPAFIKAWQNAAKQQLGAITTTRITILNAHKQFQFTGYIGAIFPIIQQNHDTATLLIPIKNRLHEASLAHGYLPADAVAAMPLPASKRNFVRILKQLTGRPYGWGGNFFFNDCSQELKSLLTPFGIWLPRNSYQQAHFSDPIDLSRISADKRLELLKTQGRPFMTIIYVGGHIVLYIGEKHSKPNSQAELMTYQNIWSIPSLTQEKRYVIGKAVFLPLSKQYIGLIDGLTQINKPIFKLIHLDHLKPNGDSPTNFAQKLLGEETSSR